MSENHEQPGPSSPLGGPIVRELPPPSLRGRWQRRQRRIAGQTGWPWRVTLEFKPADLWVGLSWERRLHDCDYDVCCNGRLHVWICLVPMLPLHVSGMLRHARQKAEAPR